MRHQAIREDDMASAETRLDQRVHPPRVRALAASTSAIPAGEDDDPSSQLAEVLDRSVHYLLSRATLGLSPMGLSAAYFDWLVHLWLSPGKQLQLWHKGNRKAVRLAAHLARCAADPALAGPPCISPLPQDQRFSSEAGSSGHSMRSIRASYCSSS